MSGVGRAPGRIVVFGPAAAALGAQSLEIAIGSGVEVVIEPDAAADGVRITSAQHPEQVSWVGPDGALGAPAGEWAQPVSAVLTAAWAKSSGDPDFRRHPLHLHVDSDLPPGVGLGADSAAALATVLALCQHLRLTATVASALDAVPYDDAVVSLIGRERQALRRGGPAQLDLQQPPLVPFDLDSAGLVLLVVDLSALADDRPGGSASGAAFEEGVQVQAAVAALMAQDWPGFGAQLTAAHSARAAAGQVSESAALAVSVLNEFGAVGARQIPGARSVLAVIHDDYVDNACIEVRRAFAALGRPYPDFRIETTTDGVLASAID